MTSRILLVRGILPLLLLVPFAGSALRASATDISGDDLVKRALATELRMARDPQHPMRYQLRRSSPRLTSTKDILETKDGAVARLLAINDKPLSPQDEQKEQERLNDLLSDPGRQWHRKQAEEQDTNRVLKILGLLPKAFLYSFVGFEVGPTAKLAKYSFRPNPGFYPPDMETRVLTAMSGTILIDTAQERVARLKGHLTKDVDFGWGILGRLDKGGWIEIDQADVGWHQWRIVRFRMLMSGRVLFRSRVFDTLLEENHFALVPVGLGYVQAIQMLRSSPDSVSEGSQ
jgi:hypothetical protein